MCATQNDSSRPEDRSSSAATRIERWIGPRISREDMARGRLQFLLPTMSLGAAGLFLVISVFLPYWRVTVRAPQYTTGIELRIHLDHLEGDVYELGTLRHLLVAQPLPVRGLLERSLATAMVVVVALLAVAAVYIHNWWAALLGLPGAVFSLVFYGDLQAWLRELEAAIPTVPGFSMEAGPGSGWILSLVASVAILLGLLLHRRAYRPLVRSRLE